MFSFGFDSLEIEDTVLEGFLKGRRSTSYSYGMQDLDPLLAKEIADMKSEQKRSAEVQHTFYYFHCLEIDDYLIHYFSNFLLVLSRYTKNLRKKA